MLKFIKVLDKKPDSAQALATLTLPYERRIISRQRVTLDDGADAGLFLPRGTVLQHGDYVATEGGVIAQVKAATETVSMLYSDEPLQLARACYHLGNRHVSVQIGTDKICYKHDHVLDDMLRGLGLSVAVEQAAFEPEPGAYGGGHSHAHDRTHDHSH